MDNTDAIHPTDEKEVNLFSPQSNLRMDFINSFEDEMQSLQMKVVELEKKNFQLLSKTTNDKRILNEITQNEGELRQIKADLAKSRADLRTKDQNISILQNEIAHIQNDLKKSETLALHLQQEYTKEREKIEQEAFQIITANSHLEMNLIRAKTRFDEVQSKSAQLQSQMTLVEEQNLALNKSISEKQAQIDRLTEKSTQLEAEIAQKSDLIAKMNRNYKTMENSTKESSDRIATLTEQLNVKTEQREQAVALYSEIQAKLTTERALAKSHEDSVQNISTQLTATQTELSQAKVTIANLTKTSECFAADTQNLKEKLISISAKSEFLAHQNLSLKAELDSTISQKLSIAAELQRERESVSKLSAHVTNLQQNIEALSAENKMATEMFRRLDERSQAQLKESLNAIETLEVKNRNLEKQLAQESEKANLLEKSFHEKVHSLVKSQQEQFDELNLKHSTQTTELFSVMSAKQNEYQEAQKKLEETTQKANYAMKQTTQYVTFVESEKNKIKSALAQLSTDIQAAISLHPLKDFLAATEMEMQRYEVELKKTPASAPTRQNLEARLDQLYKQKSNLERLIRNTELHLNSFKSQIAKVESQTSLLEVPCPVKLVNSN